MAFVCLLRSLRRQIGWLLRSLRSRRQICRSPRRQINIFGGGIAGTKNEFFETKCRKIVKPLQRLRVKELKKIHYLFL